MPLRAGQIARLRIERLKYALSGGEGASSIKFYRTRVRPDCRQKYHPSDKERSQEKKPPFCVDSHSLLVCFTDLGPTEHRFGR